MKVEMLDASIKLWLALTQQVVRDRPISWRTGWKRTGNSSAVEFAGEFCDPRAHSAGARYSAKL
jgi:hypothetical protein